MAVESSLEAEAEELFKMQLCCNGVMVPIVELGGNQFVKVSQCDNNATAAWLCTAIGAPQRQRSMLRKIPTLRLFKELSGKIEESRGKHKRLVHKVDTVGHPQSDVLTVNVDGVEWIVANIVWPIHVKADPIQLTRLVRAVKLAYQARETEPDISTPRKSETSSRSSCSAVDQTIVDAVMDSLPTLPNCMYYCESKVGFMVKVPPRTAALDPTREHQRPTKTFLLRRPRLKHSESATREIAFQRQRAQHYIDTGVVLRPEKKTRCVRGRAASAASYSAASESDVEH